MNPIALVTGANKGIGYCVAEGLGRRGLTIVVGARHVDRGEKAAHALRAAGVDARFVHLDVSDDDSVARAARELTTRFGRLDVLVNNAGIKLEFHPAPPSRASMDVIRKTYATNVFGTISVTLAMLPLLRRAPAARIVNMSSGLASMTLASKAGSKHAEKCMLSYNTSKAAINAVTVQFANELRGTPIKVNAVDPGYTNSDMTRRDGVRTPEQAARIAIELATVGDDGPTGGFFDEHGPLPW